MKRPLRSVLIGDVDYYPSEYIFGVSQGMTLLGHWHRTVNIRGDIDLVAKVLKEVQPDLIWGHMLLWAPGGMQHTSQLLDLCAIWKKKGTRVLIHDGDARQETRFPMDISMAVDLVLCNHSANRSPWKIRRVRWPYFAFVQHEISDPVPEFQRDLVFAGRLGEGIYSRRSQFVQALSSRLSTRFLVLSGEYNPHTLFRTPEVAASATSVLGYARPESSGWLDVRCFQYPGAGGVLLYDGKELGEFLRPWEHFVPYDSDNVDSVVLGIEWARNNGDSIRRNAFYFVQRDHSSVSRVAQALMEVGL